MNEHQRQIASEAIARIVAEALESSKKPSGADLVELAENAATAIAAGFAKLDAAKSCS